MPHHPKKRPHSDTLCLQPVTWEETFAETIEKAWKAQTDAARKEQHAHDMQKAGIGEYAKGLAKRRKEEAEAKVKNAEEERQRKVQAFRRLQRLRQVNAKYNQQQQANADNAKKQTQAEIEAQRTKERKENEETLLATKAEDDVEQSMWAELLGGNSDMTTAADADGRVWKKMLAGKTEGAKEQADKVLRLLETVKEAEKAAQAGGKGGSE